MKFGFREMSLTPETAEEIRECETPDGMRRRLRRYSFSDALTRQVLDASEMRGLSGEDKMTWLAFEALKRLERYEEMAFEKAMLEPSPPILVKAKP